MLGTRLASGTTLGVGLLVILILDEWLAPWYPLWFVVSCLVMVLCALEVVGLLQATGNPPSTSTVVGGILALVVANWVPHLIDPLLGTSARASTEPPDPLTRVNVMAWPMWTFVAVLMATFLVQSARFRRPGGTLATIAGTTLTLAYVGLLGGFIIQFRWFDGAWHGLVPLAYLLATAKGTDIGAYTVGRIAGRHKLWPILSPNKTVEGALGGILFGVVGALGVRLLVWLSLDKPSLSLNATVVFGVIVAIAAQLGDLMESMIKRDSEQKDASATVPGFGGLLDVLDSLLFAAPVAYGFWVWVNP